MRREPAVITVYVSLVFLLLLTLTGALLESAAVQTAKNNAKETTGLALESVFAEYDPDLQEKYHIFAVNGCRKGGSDPEQELLQSLRFYRADTQGAKVGKMQLLSDEKGKEFYEQAVRYMEEKGTVEEALLEQAEALSEAEQQEEITEKLQVEAITGFAHTLSELEGGEPVTGLFSLFAGFFGRPVLQIAMPQGKTVSASSIDLNKAASHRSLREGHGVFTGHREPSLLSDTLFDLYLLDVMNQETDEPKESGLSYEIEYILAGEESDRKNLENVAGRLILIRTAFNAQYLKESAVRQTEITQLAIFLAAVLAAPECEEAIREAVTYVWSYAEAVMDIKALFDDKKVPLNKDDQSWTLSLEGLLSFEKSVAEGWESADEEEGLSYKDYLRMLLALESRQTKCMRALDLIETNLCGENKAKAFRSDSAVCRVQIDSSCVLPRSVHYDFTTAFAYR
ncbi:MAG: hypothetical protein IJI30_07440 [Lachnospiraceae bacterium]|nr:hypothetical protein [Lachnospiraceae bacterium]